MPNQKRVRQKAARAAKLVEQRKLAKRNQFLRRIVLVVIVAAVVIGTAFAFISTAKTPSTTSTSTTSTIPAADTAAQVRVNLIAKHAGCSSNPNTIVNHQHYTHLPKMTIATNRLYYATFETTAGKFVVELEPKEAPVGVNSFIFLADHHFYNCVTFQRTWPGFMIQGGDPSVGTAELGYTLPDEDPKVGHPTYPVGTIAYANGGPHTSSDQFFVCTGSGCSSLSNTYIKFGKVVSGLKTALTIAGYGDAADNGTPPFVTERMLSVTISTTPPS